MLYEASLLLCFAKFLRNEEIVQRAKCGVISHHRFPIRVMVLYFIFFCPARISAQTSRVGATLQGTVTDSSGAVIADAKVILRNTLTNQGRIVISDSGGFYRAEQLPAGSYDVRVEESGLAAYRLPTLQVNLGRK